jgi:predicted O-methyltransferase YrrM
MKKMKSVPLNDELYNYILDKFVPEESLLEELINETKELGYPLIQISPEQGKFLYLICKMIRAETALEIGTLTGFSGIYIARGLIENGKLTTVDIEPKHTELACKYFDKAGLRNKIEVIVSAGLDYMRKAIEENRKYDLIFIDAEKKNYPNYFEEAFKLSKPGTVLAFDNTIKGGNIVNDAGDDENLRAIQKTNDLMSADKRVESLLIPIGDGITFGVVKK